jgi:hypothetical protein
MERLSPGPRGRGSDIEFDLIRLRIKSTRKKATGLDPKMRLFPARLRISFSNFFFRLV